MDGWMDEWMDEAEPFESGGGLRRLARFFLSFLLNFIPAKRTAPGGRTVNQPEQVARLAAVLPDWAIYSQIGLHFIVVGV